MKNMAFGFVVLAFLGGAFLTSLDEDTVNWTYFVPVMVLGFIGAFVYIKEANKAATHGDLLKNNMAILDRSLHNIAQNLVELDGNKEAIPTYEMRFEIDRLFREDLMQFADARHSIKHLYGVQAYADVMSSFAAGERYINRIWSASTDGYVDEVLLYVSKANKQFEHAREVFDASHVQTA